MTAPALHPRYDVRILRLAVGVEPRDAGSGLRSAAPLRVLVENAPAPLHAWRRWRPGESLDDVLPQLPCHRTGRFGSVYRRDGAGGTLRLRVVDGRARRIVPRRLEIVVPDEAAVASAEQAVPARPLPRRTFPVGMFPGAAGPVGTRATVLRGRVTGSPVVAGGPRPPLRWARVSAADELGDVVGWAHGDDRGEFVLVVGGGPDTAAVPDDPLALRLTVSVAIPAAVPDPLDPLRPEVDPLWDLPVERVPAVPALADALLAGHVRLPAQTPFGPFPVVLPLGRETSLGIPID